MTRAPVRAQWRRARLHPWVQPLICFLQVESAAGVVLLLCTVLALSVANSPWAGQWQALWQTHFVIGIGPYQLDESLLHWINDGLMTIFFFVVGLEIKREVVDGELSDLRKAALPVVAALGGMIAPALIYFAQRFGREGARGWGIPMATDIAFVVGVLTLFGRRVPLGLKILLLSLAIADDIGAILVIALFYTADLKLMMLALGVSGFALIWLLTRLGVRWHAVYVIIGAGIWLAFFVSGVHPTVAGVVLGLMCPAEVWIGEAALTEVLAETCRRLESKTATPEERRAPLSELAETAREGIAPLERVESALHPWVSFLIMPLFALANAGVAIHVAELTSPVSVAVATGLLFGKPIGILLFSAVAVRLGLARLPRGVNWWIMLAAGCLGGIGFTMSLFIAHLGLPENLLDSGKMGTLAGSLLSAVLGSVLLAFTLPKSPK